MLVPLSTHGRYPRSFHPARPMACIGPTTFFKTLGIMAEVLTGRPDLGLAMGVRGTCMQSAARARRGPEMSWAWIFAFTTHPRCRARVSGLLGLMEVGSA